VRYQPENPLIVQSDHTMLLETMGPHFKAVRDELVRFAELVKSPEYVHTYRVTPLSLWNAAASGVTIEQVHETLESWSKYDVPPNVPVHIRETMGRYGRLKLLADDASGGLRLVAADSILMREIVNTKQAMPFLGARIDDNAVAVSTADRGEIKHALLAVGHPVEDLAGYVDGESLEIGLDSEFAFRDYQVNAVEAFSKSGSGVIVLPCGAGKTIVGIGALEKLQTRALILCTNVTALRQWRNEILEKTSLNEDDLAEYSGSSKTIGPVTLSTYQMLTWRRSKDSEFEHFGIFQRANWGLIIYDEVHLLPAPVFRAVAHLQARRRLGLTATLVREDGKQGEVFALIGPKRFDMPWKDLEHQGWIASASCREIRIPFKDDERLRYAVADDREKFKLASLNGRKGEVVEELLQKHKAEKVLILGMYLSQLEHLAAVHEVPLITGKTPQSTRDVLFEDFREGRSRVMVVSKVGNFSVDLPDAAVAIQVSGTWGSRQEEAQRLGRILRPKEGANEAFFYTLVTRDSREQDFAEKRQLFLTEQGYAYEIEARA
jgi:DNA excision repair protein ERCC-3